MSITNVKRVHNAHTQLAFVVQNHHNPDDTTDPSSRVPPTGYFIHDMWVPWCKNQKDFDGHGAEKPAFISITSDPPGISFTIWQQECPDFDGDQVRFSKDGAFHPCGEDNLVPNEKTKDVVDNELKLFCTCQWQLVSPTKEELKTKNMCSASLCAR